MGKKVFHLTSVKKWQEKDKDGGGDMAVFKDTVSFISNEAARTTVGMRPAYSSQAHLNSTSPRKRQNIIIPIID